MTIKLEYIPLQGGMDESTGPTVPRAGRLLGCENYEITFGTPGYRRINGYERFSGQPAPSAANYTLLPYTSGTIAFSVGDTVTGGTSAATGYVLRVNGTTASGTLVIMLLTGTFSASEALKVATVTRATSNGVATSGSAGDAAYATDVVLARTYRRNQIAQPVGEGAILGVAILNNTVYCLRNVVGSATATLWGSTSSGWAAVRTGLRPSGTMRSEVATFSGTAGTLGLFGTDGKNRPWKFDGTTFTFFPAVYGTEATSVTSITPALGSKTFTFSETSRSWAAGTVIRVYSQTNAANYMVGTYTSSTSTTLTINVTSFGGTTAADWFICRDDGIDRPYIVMSHKNYLWMAYPKGQLQSSDLGSPLTTGTTSMALAMGDEIVDLRTLRSDVLAVMQQTRINLVYGSSSLDLQNKQHSLSSNTKAQSTVEVGGNAIYLADSGLMAMNGSLNFGNFDTFNLAKDAINSLRTVMADYKTTAVIKKDSQYRIYGAAKEVLVMTWFGGQVTPDSIFFSKLRYAHQVVCTAGATISGDEYNIFGTDDGWVMRERIGTTFDGADITAFFRTSHWHCGNPQIKKRFRKITLDADADGTVQIYFRQDLDFAGPDYSPSITWGALPSGGFYDVDYWNEFFWSNPETAQQEVNVDGVGRHMSLVFWTQGDYESHNIYGMGLQYSPLEIKR